MVTPARSSPVSSSPPVFSASRLPARPLPGETQPTGFAPKPHVHGRKAAVPSEAAPLGWPVPCSAPSRLRPLRAPRAPVPPRVARAARAPDYRAGPPTRGERPRPRPARRRVPRPGHQSLTPALGPSPGGPETKAARPLRRRLLPELRLPGTGRWMGRRGPCGRGPCGRGRRAAVHPLEQPRPQPSSPARRPPGSSGSE